MKLLEEIINQVAVADEDLNLFGDYIRRRREVLNSSDMVKFHDKGILPPDEKSSQFGRLTARRAAACFGRYMTLLERLIAMIPGPLNDYHAAESRMEEVYRSCCGLVEQGYKWVVD